MRRRCYKVFTYRHLEAVAPLLQQLADRSSGARVVFQDLRWLRPWYYNFERAGVKPLIAVIIEGSDSINVDKVALVLPLIRRTEHFLPVVEFADRGVTDYNFPIIGPRVPRIANDMRALMSALYQALRPFALLRLRDMPYQLEGQVNPFALLEESRISEVLAHNMGLPLDGTGFVRSFGKKKRVEIERAARALDALGENHFATVTDQHSREQVFALIQQAQRVRVPEKGYRYVLEDPGYRQFYETIVFDPRTADLTVVAAIWLAERPVAGLLGLRYHDRFIALRIGVANEPAILRLGLGKVLLMRTAEWAISENIRIFDFSIGSSSLKSWFHPASLELIEYKALLNGHIRWQPIPSCAKSASVDP